MHPLGASRNWFGLFSRQNGCCLRIEFSSNQIRSYIHSIETGRFSKTPRNERICLHCKTDNFSEIDDEQHLLLKCSGFSEIRKALFDHVRKSCPRIDTLNDENKFIYLLNSSGSTIKEVAKFLHSAYSPFCIGE